MDSDERILEEENVGRLEDLDSDERILEEENVGILEELDGDKKNVRKLYREQSGKKITE